MEKENFTKEYNKRRKALKQECDDMVARGELSKTDGTFRYFMMKDEILQEMKMEEENENN